MKPETALSETPDVADWLASIQPGRQAGDWPPVTRPIEHDVDIALSVDGLVAAIATFVGDDAHFDELLSDVTVIDDFRRMLAQVGSARLIRIVSDLTDRLQPGRVAGVLDTLRDPRTPEGRAIEAVLDANARITLRGRLVAQERLDTLRHALDQPKETSL